MPGFLGSYLHQLDPKGRVSLPAPFRRGRESDPFVLIRVQPEALSLYPDDDWATVQADLRLLAKRQPELRHQVLGITANATRVVPDKQGRILIPERMRGEVGLGGEALVVGALDHIEIWDPERFEQATSQRDDVFDRHIQAIFA